MVYACQPCPSTLNFEETVEKSDLIIIGQRTDFSPLVEYLLVEYLSEGPDSINVNIIEILKGNTHQNQITVNSWDAMCGYGIVVDDKEYVMLLQEKDNMYDAVDFGCSVKTFSVDNDLVDFNGEKISMLILLPKQGEDYDFETRERIVSDYTLEDVELSTEKLNEYKSQMQETKLDSISLPKFEFDTKYFMKKTLSAMGMPTAFGKADFSGMDGTRNLIISHVIHQAFVKVDEQGTEAAAATAVVVIKVSTAMPRNVFRADHPFIFIIQEKETGNILFMGRVTDPTK